MNRPRARQVKGHPGYWVTNTGQVWSTRRGGVARRLKPAPNSSGYPSVTLRGKTHLVHRLVARAFLGEPEGRIVRHLDGKKDNPRLDNLVYGSHADNARDHAAKDIADAFAQRVLAACLI